MTNPLHPFYTSRAAKRQYEIDNAAWLLPLRDAFHNHMVEHEGYRPMVTPEPGSDYPGSHMQASWECWLAATLHARSASTPQHPANNQQ